MRNTHTAVKKESSPSLCQNVWYSICIHSKVYSLRYHSYSYIVLPQPKAFTGIQSQYLYMWQKYTDISAWAARHTRKNWATYYCIETRQPRIQLYTGSIFYILLHFFPLSHVYCTKTKNGVCMNEPNGANGASDRVNRLCKIVRATALTSQWRQSIERNISFSVCLFHTIRLRCSDSSPIVWLWLFLYDSRLCMAKSRHIECSTNVLLCCAMCRCVLLLYYVRLFCAATSTKICRKTLTEIHLE